MTDKQDVISLTWAGPEPAWREYHNNGEPYVYPEHGIRLYIPGDRCGLCTTKQSKITDLAKRLARALDEWRHTPFFQTEEEWEQWLTAFHPTVDAALAEAREMLGDFDADAD